MARRDNGRARYSTSLASVLQSAAVPYGVTLTVWASGEAVSHYRGAPQVFEIFLFVLGGVCGYAALTAALAQAPAEARGRHMARAGMLHVLSIGPAVGAVTLIAQIRSWLAWPLAGFAGIGLYLGLVGLELIVAAREAPRA